MKHRSAGVASRAIELALQGRTVTVNEIQRGLSKPPSRQTIYRVFRQLEADDWIEQDGNEWHPDVKANLLSGDGSGDDRDGDQDDGDRRHDRGGPLVDVDDIL